MEINTEKIDDTTLALLYLVVCEQHEPSKTSFSRKTSS